MIFLPLKKKRGKKLCLQIEDCFFNFFKFKKNKFKFITKKKNLPYNFKI